jgi:hypothetical protein
LDPKYAAECNIPYIRGQMNHLTKGGQKLFEDEHKRNLSPEDQFLIGFRQGWLYVQQPLGILTIPPLWYIAHNAGRDVLVVIANHRYQGG